MARRVAVGGGDTERREQRLAVIDMGSNTFRLVVFRYVPGGAFQLTEEVRESVRLSAGQVDGVLAADALDRAGIAAGLYASFCAASNVDVVDPVATSAVRDATNQGAVIKRLSADGKLPVRVLSAYDEARYGYLGAINSTTLRNGTVLDIGGGSLQLGRVEKRQLTAAGSWPLGAVRMTEQVLGDGVPAAARVAQLRKHVLAQIGSFEGLAAGEPNVAMGGSIRTLAAMAQRATGYPLGEVHGYRLDREVLQGLIDQMASLAGRQRARIPGLKADRADITLAGAIVLDTIMERLELRSVEVCAQGLRWGVFYEHYLGVDEPLFPDVRAASVRNVAAIYRYDKPHAEHVATLALRIFDELGRLGLHPSDDKEREWLWAAAILHDVGVIVDYNDHHKHGAYLVMNAGLPGFRHRELVIIALLVRGHRKALPSPNGLAEILQDGDDQRLLRLAVCLRLAEQLERGRGQRVQGLSLSDDGEALTLHLDATADVSVARWAAASEAANVERATGRRLEISLQPA
jgi:exopolyphosphatase / guanosine-5'-triphosphate,3'-diphosphate pyrophosphatase